jgi:hypothetical protein
MQKVDRRSRMFKRLTSKLLDKLLMEHTNEVKQQLTTSSAVNLGNSNEMTQTNTLTALEYITK